MPLTSEGKPDDVTSEIKQGAALASPGAAPKQATPFGQQLESAISKANSTNTPAPFVAPSGGGVEISPGVQPIAKPSRPALQIDDRGYSYTTAPSKAAPSEGMTGKISNKPAPPDPKAAAVTLAQPEAQAPAPSATATPATPQASAQPAEAPGEPTLQEKVAQATEQGIKRTQQGIEFKKVPSGEISASPKYPVTAEPGVKEMRAPQLTGGAKGDRQTVEQRMANSRMGSAVRAQQVRGHVALENQHGMTSTNERGSLRRGVAMNAAVELGQQDFNAKVNEWRATTPPAMDLDQYDQQFQQFAASLGPDNMQFASQLQQMFFQNMPPQIRSDYNARIAAQQAELKTARELRQKEAEGLIKQVFDEAGQKTAAQYARELAKGKKSDELAFEEQNADRIKGVSMKKAMTEAEGAGLKKLAEADAQEEIDAAYGPRTTERKAKEAAAIETAKEEVRAPTKGRAAEERMAKEEVGLLKEYRAEHKDAMSEYDKATSELTRLLYDKDGVEIEPEKQNKKAIEIARQRLADAETDMKDARAQYIDQKAIVSKAKSKQRGSKK